MKQLLIIFLSCLFLSPCWAGADLDGTNGYISATFSWTPATFSVSFWLYPESTKNYNQQIMALNAWGEFLFHTTADGGVYCGTDVGKRFTPTDLGNGTVVENTWQHFVYTHDGTNGNFYKNGSLLAGPKAQDPSGNWGGFSIGKSDGNTIDGKITEVVIWDVALTVPEISLLYNSKVKEIPLQIRPANLKLYWPLDDYAAGTTINYSISAGTATTNPVAGVPSRLVDGFIVVQWESGENILVDFWVKIDLGEAMEINEYRLYNSPADGPIKYKVQSSTNDSDWDDRLTVTTGGGDDSDTFGAATARYWRILVTENRTRWWRCYEFYLKVPDSPKITLFPLYFK